MAQHERGAIGHHAPMGQLVHHQALGLYVMHLTHALQASLKRIDPQAYGAGTYWCVGATGFDLRK
jgi:hypothetical protein